MEGFYVVFDRQQGRVGFATSTCQNRDPQDASQVKGPFDSDCKFFCFFLIILLLCDARCHTNEGLTKLGGVGPEHITPVKGHPKMSTFSLVYKQYTFSFLKYGFHA